MTASLSPFTEEEAWVAAHKDLSFWLRLRVRFARGPKATDWFKEAGK